MLFVTSFDDQLYGASGRDMVRSFIAKQIEGQLLLCYEGHRPQEVDGQRILGFDITRDPFLVRWDSKYRAICNKHTSYWRRRAWQWYRKCVSLRLAARYLDPRWLIWIDCDCEFKLTITEEALKNMFPHDGVGILHLIGSREWTETGFLVFDRKNVTTKKFLSAFFGRYESGEFLQLERWDDCWIFDAVRKKFYSELCHDIAAGSPGLRVMDNSRISEFILHKKGSHLKEGVR